VYHSMILKVKIYLNTMHFLALSFVPDLPNNEGYDNGKDHQCHWKKENNKSYLALLLKWN